MSDSFPWRHKKAKHPTPPPPRLFLNSWQSTCNIDHNTPSGSKPHAPKKHNWAKEQRKCSILKHAKTYARKQKYRKPVRRCTKNPILKLQNWSEQKCVCFTVSWHLVGGLKKHSVPREALTWSWWMEGQSRWGRGQVEAHCPSNGGKFPCP